MAYSEFTEKDYELIAAEYAILKEDARKRCADEEELAIVQRAFDFANEAHKNIRRRSGEPYMLHPIAVARIVVEDIGLGCKSITAALLHDVVEDTDYTVDDIRNLFGDKVASLVDGLTKIKNVLDTGDKTISDPLAQQSLQAENFKRILLTLNDDVRVVLIKLADRLHNCRTIQHMPEHKRDKILSETMFVFIPLAHQLGLYSIKSELENIWLQYKEPAAYKEVSAKISAFVRERGKDMEAFVAPIDKALKEAGFRFEIKRRVKTPYSVWRKMRVKDITFDQVYDLYAIRIIFEADQQFGKTERDQCWRVFSIITDIYRYNPERLRDWVSNTKANGYEALHCTLIGPGGVWFEVQIRTHRMDDIAEKGIAAHWAYKKDGYIGEEDSEIESWLSRVKEILRNPDVSSLELLDIIHNDLTSSEIFVFTPKGEQRTIQKGSTVLDFAYMIHTEIGNRAIVAKVNKRLVPLSRVLRSGDQIEIITAEEGTPKKEWLQFLHTRRARSVVMDYFRDERKQNIEDGRKLLTEHLQGLGYNELDDETRRRLLFYYQLGSMDDLYLRIGLGIVKIDGLHEFFAKKNRSSAASRFWTWWRPRKNGDQATVHGGYIIATCCNPVPGDAVVGIKSPDGTITVHKKTCPVADSVGTKHGDWIVVPNWDVDPAAESFCVQIQLKGIDRIGLVNDLTKTVSLLLNANMRKIYLASEDGIFEGYIEVYVRTRQELDTIVAKLQRIDGIESVVRKEL
ncbi:MAG: bifunctional (p)ppGpp synthetase/guanosine-3',5'-bis(diphosphate) 3'-pyrophosphohydrolase [Bacteroidales bacterium]|nr:bifunctional (p)ppGpp synthetase/guanosine-3',5'-bis(diphosphate) 3'-pyrophosphohydrolase [Bacteroidales bacterium]